VNLVTKISETTRRNIIQTLKAEDIKWSGRLDESDFLSRIYDLELLPSHDPRYKSARVDIWQHTVNNPDDWPDDWIFDDERFDLLHCPDDQFLRFLCEMIHQVVRPDQKEVEPLLEMFNQELGPEGFRIEAKRTRFGGIRFEPVGILPSTIEALQQLKDIAEKLGPEHLEREIARMNSAIERDPELAIGTAKELVETICKTILGEKSVALKGDEDLPKLVRMTMDEIKPMDGISYGRGTYEAVQKMLGILSTLTQSIAELRNLQGTGHGKEVGKVAPDSRFASLAANSAASLALFLYLSYEKQKK
jgi:hypothetical protein